MLKVLKFQQQFIYQKALLHWISNNDRSVLENMVFIAVYFPGAKKNKPLPKLAFLKKEELGSHL